MNELLGTLLAKFAEWFLESRAYGWLRSKVLTILYSKKIAYTLCGVLALISIGLGLLYWSRSRAYESVIRKTLATQLEPTPQQFKGLESFIMSNLDHDLQDRVKRLEAGTALANQWNQLVKAAVGVGKERPQAPPLLRIPIGSKTNFVFTDDVTPGFLFVSTDLCRRSLGKAERDALQFGPAAKTQQMIQDILGTEPELWRDVQFTGALATEMQRLTEVDLWATHNLTDVESLIDTRSSQAYVITKNGITRIVRRGDSRAEEHYASQFSPSTFFPSRPYFWRTFEDSKSSRSEADLQLTPGKRIDEFFDVSRPYMDLGGNGIVVTLSHGIEMDGFPQSVVCLDVSVSPTESRLPQLLKLDVEEFGEETIDATCTVPTYGKSKCTATETFDKDLKSALEGHIDFLSGRNRQAEVFGNIQILNSADVASARRPIYVSVPITQRTEPGKQVAQFLVFQLDLAKHQRQTVLIGFAAASAFGLTTVLLTSLWVLSLARERDYKVALGSVERVLTAMDIAYVRVDSEDRIEVATDQLGTLLGTTPKGLEGQRFGDLCADDRSRAEYERVQKERRAGRPVAPYELTMQVSGRAPRRVRIRSEAVPSFGPTHLPVTFGVIAAVDHHGRRV